MTQRQLASVLFATVGVFIAAIRIPEAFIQIAVLRQGNSLSVVAFGAWLLATGLGVSLILVRDRLANRLFPAATAPLGGREVQAVALSVLGCYLAIQGLSRISWAGRFDWGAATQIALGVALFLGARGLSRLWSLIRANTGPNPAERTV